LTGSDLDNYDVSSLPEEDRRNIEADSFWCLSKLLEGIQDNYTFAQPGIQNKVRQLKELIERVDGKMIIMIYLGFQISQNLNEFSSSKN